MEPVFEEVLLILNRLRRLRCLKSSHIQPRRPFLKDAKGKVIEVDFLWQRDPLKPELLRKMVCSRLAGEPVEGQTILKNLVCHGYCTSPSNKTRVSDHWALGNVYVVPNLNKTIIVKQASLKSNLVNCQLSPFIRYIWNLASLVRILLEHSKGCVSVDCESLEGQLLLLSLIHI